MSSDGLGYVKYVLAVAGAWIGWALGATIASAIWLPVTSFWARGHLLGTLLQFGGMAFGALIAFSLAGTLLDK